MFTLDSPSVSSPAPRRLARATIDEIAAARTLRRQLEAAQPGPEMAMDVACTPAPAGGEGMQEWVVTEPDGEVITFGRCMFFGVHHTLSIAIGAAVKESRRRVLDDAAATAVDDGGELAVQVPRLTVRSHDRGFGPVDRVGDEMDNGRGGKTRRLAVRAMEMGVLLTVLWTPDPMPADSLAGTWSHFDAEQRKAACEADAACRATEREARKATRKDRAAAWDDLPL